MKVLVFVAATLCVAVCSPVAKGPEPRIVGGYEAPPHSIPHQVILNIIVPGGALLCGGSLISRSWVLTAAHCVDRAQSVVMAFGAHDITQNEAGRIVMKQSSYNIIVHRGWNPQIVHNDIALIKLPYPVQLSANIQTVKLPSHLQVAAEESFAGVMGTLSGWGQVTDVHGSTPNRLREVQLPILSLRQCNSYYHALSNQHICVSGAGIKGACSGDSGGPLTVENDDGSHTQVGIASFVGQEGCEAGWPTVYTRITYFMDWIEANTGLSFD